MQGSITLLRLDLPGWPALECCACHYPTCQQCAPRAFTSGVGSIHSCTRGQGPGTASTAQRHEPAWGDPFWEAAWSATIQQSAAGNNDAACAVNGFVGGLMLAGFASLPGHLQSACLCNGCTEVGKSATSERPAWGRCRSRCRGDGTADSTETGSGGNRGM